jgi:hypothetical protein
MQSIVLIDSAHKSVYMKTYIIFFFLVLIEIMSICGDRCAEYDLVMGFHN